MRECLQQRSPKDLAPRAPGASLQGFIPQFDSAIEIDYEHAFVDRLDHVAQSRLRLLHRLQHFALLDHSYRKSGKQLGQAENCNQLVERSIGDAFNQIELFLGLGSVDALDFLEVVSNFVECRYPRAQVEFSGYTSGAL